MLFCKRKPLIKSRIKWTAEDAENMRNFWLTPTGRKMRVLIDDGLAATALSGVEAKQIRGMLDMRDHLLRYQAPDIELRDIQVDE
ncbi:MAG: hypothetical protein EOM20_03280 [Spartobacteria bacterium]|nr:hypothetical protein [Spartobacteria bacterium]